MVAVHIILVTIRCHMLYICFTIRVRCITKSVGNSHLRSNEGDRVSSALSAHQPPLPLALALVSEDATPTLVPPHPTWLFNSTSAATT